MKFKAIIDIPNVEALKHDKNDNSFRGTNGEYVKALIEGAFDPVDVDVVISENINEETLGGEIGMNQYVVRNLGEYGDDVIYLVKANQPLDAVKAVLCTINPDWKDKPVTSATLEEFCYLDITHMKLEFPGEVLMLCPTLDECIDAKTLDRKV